MEIIKRTGRKMDEAWKKAISEGKKGLRGTGIGAAAGGALVGGAALGLNKLVDLSKASARAKLKVAKSVVKSSTKSIDTLEAKNKALADRFKSGKSIPSATRIKRATAVFEKRGKAIVNSTWDKVHAKQDAASAVKQIAMSKKLPKGKIAIGAVAGAAVGGLVGGAIQRNAANRAAKKTLVGRAKAKLGV
jgi:hypothetical protein